MTLVDWIAVGIVLLAAFAGMKRGLILSAFSLAGLALGAYVGARVAPHLVSGGADSIWPPVAGLAGAVIGAGVLQVGAVLAGSYLRGGLRLTPLRVVDSTGGFLLGIVTGLAIVWVCAAVVGKVQKHPELRRSVNRSWIVQKLDAAVPPKTLFSILRVIDPQQSITGGPSPPSLPPSVGVLRNPRIHASLSRVVKVLGSACGLGIEGSGWFARRDLVVTAAHVVAGERSTFVEIPDDATQHAATVVVFDVHNDIAVLRIADGTTRRPLPLVDPRDGAAVVLAGYPLDGNLTAVPGRVGGTANEFTNDALGNPVLRAITAVAGRVRHGDSGGPVIDTRGHVEGTIFAASKHSASGYAVPTWIIRSDLAKAGPHAVSTESCAP